MADQYSWGWSDPFAPPWYDVPPYDGTRHQGTIPRPQPYGPEPIGYSGGTIPRSIPQDPYYSYSQPRPTPQQQYAAGGGAMAQQAQMAPAMGPTVAASGYQAPYAQGAGPFDYSFGTSGPQQNPYIQASTGPRQPNANPYLPSGQLRSQGGNPFQGIFIDKGEDTQQASPGPSQPRASVTYGRSAIPTQMGSRAYGIGTGSMTQGRALGQGSRNIGSVNMPAVGAWMQLPPEQQAALRAQGIAVTVNGQDPNSGQAPWKVTGGYNNPSGPTGKMQQLTAANQRAQVGSAMNAAPQPQPQTGGAGVMPKNPFSQPGRFGNRFLQNNMAMASSNAQTRAGVNQLLQGAAATGNMDRANPMVAQYYGSRNFARSQALADQQDRDRQYGLQRDALDFNQMQALAQAQAQAGNYWRGML